MQASPDHVDGHDRSIDVTAAEQVRDRDEPRPEWRCGSCRGDAGVEREQ